jgi:AGCS family alanine or glycine:cation symporter
MTGVFVDTMVICLVTGLAVGVTGAAEGILEAEKADGAAMVIQAFESVFGPAGGYVVAVGILLFAFATMAGWAYQGEQAFLWLVKKDSFGMVYRVFFCFAAFAGCVCMAETVWNFAELANACMAVPNLLCVLRLWKEVKEEAFRFESRIKKAEQKKDRNT